MKLIAVLIIVALFFARPSHAETPCDFKGISVGNKMAPAAIMAALGVTRYKTNPVRPPFDGTMAIAQKYGLFAAAELDDWNIGPHCDQTACRIPYGVSVGNDNTPVNVLIAFHEELITAIDVSFSHTFWDDILPILNQKYGANWNIDRGDMLITNYETRKGTVLERISLIHATDGVNRNTNDRCQISATNLDIVFEHHDPLGPYHSVFEIKLISKNF